MSFSAEIAAAVISGVVVSLLGAICTFIFARPNPVQPVGNGHPSAVGVQGNNNHFRDVIIDQSIHDYSQTSTVTNHYTAGASSNSDDSPSDIATTLAKIAVAVVGVAILLMIYLWLAPVILAVLGGAAAGFVLFGALTFVRSRRGMSGWSRNATSLVTQLIASAVALLAACRVIWSLEIQSQSIFLFRTTVLAAANTAQQQGTPFLNSYSDAIGDNSNGQGWLFLGILAFETTIGFGLILIGIIELICWNAFINMPVGLADQNLRQRLARRFAGIGALDVVRILLLLALVLLAPSLNWAEISNPFPWPTIPFPS